MTVLAVLDIGPLELLLVAVVAVLLFGGDLPGALRKAGRVAARLRATVHDLTRAVYLDEEPPPPRPRSAPPALPPPESPAGSESAPAAAGPPEPSRSEDPPADDGPSPPASGAGTAGA